MKRIFTHFICIYLFFLQDIPGFGQAFVTIWKTNNTGTSSNNQIIIPGTGTNYNISWEEVDNPSNTGSELGTGTHTITFPSEGTYQVSITGNFTAIKVVDGGDNKKILSIEQWGNIGWTSMHGAFSSCSNLIYNAIDIPNLSSVTDLSQMFRGCTNFNGDLSSWNTSTIIDMQSMFRDATSFNQNIESWNTSNVTNFDRMFNGATSFNMPLNGWNTSSATKMDHMFQDASSFNQDLNSWNVSNVTTMYSMFYNASAFNGNISSWNTLNVVNMELMFANCNLFNQDLSSWNTGSVTTMNYMFYRCFPFNQDIGAWNVGNVTEFYGMFQYCYVFNQDLDDWDVSSALDMRYMFAYANDFNQDLNSWNTSNVIYMSYMFRNSESFNGNISNWDVSNVTTMRSMFNRAYAFNCDISGWNINSLNEIIYMFRTATSFNQPVGSWNTANLSNLAYVFENASSFNKSLKDWDISNVSSMYNMLNGTALSIENYDSTLIGWANQGIASKTAKINTINTGVPLGSSGLEYCNAEAERTVLVNTHGWTITGDSKNCSVLPIKLESFNAKYNKDFKYVDISWSTSSEVNNDYFIVERSTDGFHFESIKTIEGAGNSTERIEYMIEDAYPKKGENFYRLKQIDFDGEFTYSEIRVVDVSKATENVFSFSIRPNPSNGKFNIKYDHDDKYSKNKEVLIVVLDISGNEHYSKAYPLENMDNQFININMENKLAPGIYFVTGSSNDRYYRQRIVIN